LGLICGTISVCVRRWLGGTLRATAAGSIAGFLIGVLGTLQFLQHFTGAPSDRMPGILGFMYSSVLLGAFLGACAGARWSRGREAA
jgi:hypothetical protein